LQIELTLNGDHEQFEAGKADSLLDVLRHNGYTGAKRGCDTGACGFCTVETIEGLGDQDDLHPVQEAFVDNSALQCGFCIPGMIMRSKALLDDNPDPSEPEVREGLSDNLCRCTGYKKIVESVLDAADRMDAVAADGGHADGRSRSAGAFDADGCGCCQETGGDR